MSSSKDFLVVLEKIAADDPQRLNKYNAEACYYKENTNSLAYAPKAAIIKNKLNSMKNEVKLADLELFKTTKTHTNQKFYQKFISNEKHNIIILASNSMIARIKNTKQIFIDGFFKVY